MNGKPNPSSDAVELRRRAEARLRKQQRNTAPPQTEADTQRLLHELQVHQIELEMQNAELQETRDAMETMLERYTDLYDFAPVGYFSIDEQDLILEVNLTGAALLGVERSRLIHRRLQRFVASMSRPIVRAFLERAFAERGKQVCEAALLKEDGTPLWADLQASCAASLRGERKWCRVAVSDITPLKRAEEMQRHMEAVAAANQELKQEIVRRQAVEEALIASEQHSSQLLAESVDLQKQLRHLSHRILQTQEEERKRISRELHDQIAQTLVGIHVHLAALTQHATVDTRGLKSKIVRTQRLVEESVNSVQRFARELRPMLLDDLGLVPALHSYMRDFVKRTGLRIRFTSFTGGRIEGLDSDTRTVLYRVAQEALTNVTRHAQASLVKASIRKSHNAIHLQIKDNGKSFEVKRTLSATRYKRLGLLCMRERVEMMGGTLTIESEPGKGTTIGVEIPFGNSRRNGPSL